MWSALKKGMLLVFAIGILLLVTTVSYQLRDDPETEPDSQSQQLNPGQVFTEEEKKKLKLDVDSRGFDIEEKCSYEIYSFPKLKGHSFVKVVFDNDWDEMLYHIFEDENGKRMVEEVPDGAGCYDDISFHDYMKLPEQYGSIVLAVSSSTHMGNGLTIIFAFTKDGTMKKLLEAGQTVDKNYDSEDGVVYHDGLLDLWIENYSKYSKYSVFVFSGEFNQYGVDMKTKVAKDQRLYRIGKYKRVYRFDETKWEYKVTQDTDKTIEQMDGVMTFREFNQWQYDEEKK